MGQQQRRQEQRQQRRPRRQRASVGAARQATCAISQHTMSQHHTQPASTRLLHLHLCLAQRALLTLLPDDGVDLVGRYAGGGVSGLSLIHISEPTRQP